MLVKFQQSKEGKAASASNSISVFLVVQLISSLHAEAASEFITSTP